MHTFQRAEHKKRTYVRYREQTCGCQAGDGEKKRVKRVKMHKLLAVKQGNHGGQNVQHGEYSE